MLLHVHASLLLQKKGDTTNVTLGIPVVEPQHYNYKFTIEAVNVYGTRAQSLYLYRGWYNTPLLNETLLHAGFPLCLISNA